MRDKNSCFKIALEEKKQLTIYLPVNLKITRDLFTYHKRELQNSVWCMDNYCTSCKKSALLQESTQVGTDFHYHVLKQNGDKKMRFFENISPSPAVNNF